MTTSVKTLSRPTMINGIDVDEVRELIETVRGDPAEGETRWKVSSTWQGGTQTRAHIKSFHIGGGEVKRSFTIDIDEPEELGGGNLYPNPQEHLMAALNACLTVGYVALCALHGITLEKLDVISEGTIDLRGFFGLDPAVAAGYESLRYTVRIKGDGTDEQFARIHEMVMATSPNYHNLSRPVRLRPTLIIE